MDLKLYRNNGYEIQTVHTMCHKHDASSGKSFMAYPIFTTKNERKQQWEKNIQESQRQLKIL